MLNDRVPNLDKLKQTTFAQIMHAGMVVVSMFCRNHH